MSLKELREKVIPKTKDIPEEYLSSWDRWYVEKNYSKNKVFKLLIYLRMKGANINKFLDQEIKNTNLKNDE